MIVGRVSTAESGLLSAAKNKLVAERKLAEKAVKRLIDRIVEIDNELESME